MTRMMWLMTGVVMSSIVVGGAFVFFTNSSAPISDDLDRGNEAAAVHRERDRSAGGLPNVLLITIDTLRSDRLSCYGYRRHQTPAIDRLANSGAVFEQAFCDVTWTTPSMASVMTSTYGTVHGLRSSLTDSLAEKSITMAEILSEHGYATSAVIGSFPLDAMYGLNQGFDLYDDNIDGLSARPVEATPKVPGAPLPAKISNTMPDPRRSRDKIPVIFNRSARSDKDVTNLAIDWLKRERVRPFFMWVHYFGPHSRPVRGEVAQTLSDYRKVLARRIGVYDSLVRQTDQQVGRLLEAVDELSMRENTIIVFHADHGESLLEHGAVGHEDLYEPSLRIPLIISYPPRIPAGARIANLARNIDILPSVLDAIGIEANSVFDGSSLLPMIDGEGAGRSGSEPDHTYIETHLRAYKGFAPLLQLPDGSTRSVGVILRGIRTLRWKYLSREPVPLRGDPTLPALSGDTLESLRTEELYDLRSDRGELRNLVDERPEVAARFRELLAVHVANEVANDREPDLELNSIDRAQLRALGYLE